MNRVQPFYQTTVELLELLQQDNKKAERDQLIEQINGLIEKRAEQMQQIQPPYSDEEDQLGQQVVALNQQVQTKLDLLLNEVKQDVRTVKKQKNTNTKYTNPYKNLSNFDGMFLDSKK
ncbi:flagellar protein FliT [Aquibacillus sediminis]|uniref:flagellar protein FliT n=1 Tax=Aquibacillus sediminis TaxID=2574734 RepID=UPI001109D230|nr:flagellar protein FliT [Aquibacillus sediminis]